MTQTLAPATADTSLESILASMLADTPDNRTHWERQRAKDEARRAQHASALYPQGLPLSALTPLSHVSPEHSEKPVGTLDLPALVGPIEPYIRYEYGYGSDAKPLADFDLPEVVRRLPWEAFGNWTHEQYLRAQYSDFIMWKTHNLIGSDEHDVDGMPQVIPTIRVFGRISNSIWRYGAGSGDWNAVVDAYNALRSFRFASEGVSEQDFHVTLTWATSCNEWGYSACVRDLFLDGTFGLLVHYRGEHVLTIGLSVASKRRVLVTQVQLRKPKGNRWLYKLPTGLMDYVLARVHEAFEATHAVHIVSGVDLAERLAGQKRAAFDNFEERRLCYEKEGRKPYWKPEDEPKLMSPEVFERIRGLYDGELAEYTRETTKEATYTFSGWGAQRTTRYYRLVRRTDR